MYCDRHNAITLSVLRKAARRNPDGVKRLAEWLDLYTDGYSARRIANLIRWRVTR